MSRSHNASTGSAVRLDDLIALNHEIIAIVRAGIPLELGLKGLHGSVSFRLSQLTDRLAKRLANGMGLVEALQQEGAAVSPVYTAVVQAGLSSGKLPEVLSALTSSAELEREMNRRVTLAMIHPSFIAVIGSYLLVLFVLFFAPAYVSTVEMFRLPHTWTIDFLKASNSFLRPWGVIIPVIVLLTCILLFVVQTRSQHRSFLGTLLPGVGSVRRSLEWSRFAELLRLQLVHGVPLPIAFRCASESIENSRIRSAVSRVSDELNRGRSLSDALSTDTTLPAMMRWMLSTSKQQETILDSLELLSESYRERSFQYAAFFRFWLPILTTALISGTIVLIYSLLFFIPLTQLWNGISAL
ncbi:MAG: hypothetical protein FJ267_05045 [Planctomycetes bacterium]|nr:hypothetical protein [Planctomycetota bacterium]